MLCNNIFHTGECTAGARAVPGRPARLLQGGFLICSAVFLEPALADSTPKPTDALPEVLVEGSRILNADVPRTADDAQPYVVFDRTVIERSAATNIEDFLKNRLTMNVSPSTYSQGTFGNMSSINLRGLGADETLVLIDGRRGTAFNLSGTPQQPDLNGIPLAAVERIEILPTTASGIYGGGATGGVVNVVLRRDYEGLQLGLTHGSAFDGAAKHQRMDVSGGFNLEGGRTNILFAGSYMEADPLRAGDRNFLRRGRAQVLANNPAYYFDATVPPLGATTNIRSLSGNLTLRGSNQSLESAMTYVPYGYAGVTSDGGAALLANAGQYNLDLADTAQLGGGAGASLLNGPTVESLLLTVRRQFGERIEGFVEFFGADNRGAAPSNAGSDALMLLAGAPGNPFNETVMVTTPLLGLDGEAESISTNRRLIGGLIFELPAAWKVSAEYAWGRSKFSNHEPGGLAYDPVSFELLAQTALNAGAFDVMRDTRAYPVDFSPYQSVPSTIPPVHSTLKSATVRAAGPVGRLPGGRPSITMLVERRDEHYSDTYLIAPLTNFLFPSRSQVVTSAYLEARLPFVSAVNRLPGMELLELQVAGRWDDYELDGASMVNLGAGPAAIDRRRSDQSSVDPTVGLRYRPVRDAMLRTSYATGYLPPGVHQLVPNPVAAVHPSISTRLRDPLRGNEPLGSYGPIQQTSGGNPELQPEQSQSWSAGVVLTPRFVPDLRLSVDWTRIRKHDNITSLRLTQDTLASEEYVPGLITRGAPLNDGYAVGPITAVHTGLLNIARLDAEAIDFAVDYRRDLDWAGQAGVSLAATRLLHLDTRLTRAAPIVENAGVSTTLFPESGLTWKASGTLAWSYRSLDVSWTSRYFDGYWLNAAHAVAINHGGASVPRQIYHDVAASYRFASSASWPLLEDLELQVAALNVFDKSPPADTSTPLGSLYSLWGDPRRGSYSLTIRKSF